MLTRASALELCTVCCAGNEVNPKIVNLYDRWVGYLKYTLEVCQ